MTTQNLIFSVLLFIDINTFLITTEPINKYPKYDNYDGINVDKTEDIPFDYDGHIGVPITFLHKFNPDQFEIIKFRKGNDGKDLSIDRKCPYFRILIRNRRLQNMPEQDKIQQRLTTIEADVLL